MKEAAQRTTRLAAGTITACLVSGAVLSVGFWFAMALSPAEVGLMESPLLLAVARQLRAGPWELYGPFGGRNPLVLIHAPLYYRLAALAAAPIAEMGTDAVTAALRAGRSLSVLSLVATTMAAYRLARRDATRRRAGWWAALLLLASPVLGGTPFSVRPDMMGVAVQTIGVLLVLGSLQNPRAEGSSLLWAFAMFGLAMCTKQHLLAAPTISFCLLMSGWRQGRVSGRSLASAAGLTTAIVAAYYCAEQMASGGRMSQAVFGAAAQVSRVHPGSWLHVETVFAAVAGNSAGLIAITGGAAVAAIGTRVPSMRASFILRALGAGLVIALTALTTLQVFWVRLWIGWAVLAAALVTLLLVLATLLLVAPAAALLDRFKPPAGVDAHLLIYLAGELVVVLVLSRLSEGAWMNYAIFAIVLGAVLTGRAANRALDSSTRPWVGVVLSLSAISVPAAVCMDLKAETARRRSDHALLAQIVSKVGHPVSEYFFAERPEHNRAAGRLELVYDDWLYPVFESIALAQDRSHWLPQALRDGPVRVVVSTAEPPRVTGIKTPLSVLGYQRVARFGPYWVYVKSPERGDRL